MFEGGGWGSSQGQKIMYNGLPLPTFVRNKGRVRLFGVCVLNQRNTVIFILEVDITKIF